MKLEIVKKSYGIAAVIAAIQFGIFGLLYCQLLLDVLEFFVNSFYCGRMINYSVKEQVKDFSPSISLAAVVGVVAWSLDKRFFQVSNTSDIIRILAVSLLYMTVYLIFSLLLKIPALYDFKKIIGKDINFKQAVPNS